MLFNDSQSQPVKPDAFDVFSKEARRTLIGINQQVDDLTQVSKNTFSHAQAWVQNDWNKDLNTIKDKITELSKQFPKQEKRIYLAELNKLKDEYSLTKEELNKIFEMQDPSSQLDSLISQSIIFASSFDNAEKLLNETAAKLCLQKTKLEKWNCIESEKEENTLHKVLDYFIFKVKDVLHPFSIVNGLNNSIPTHEQMVKDHADLKMSWFETFSLHRDIQHQILSSVINKGTYSKIQKDTKELEELSDKFMPIQATFKAINASELNNMPKEGKEAAIEHYKSKIEEFLSIYPKIKLLCDSLIKDSQDVRDTVLGNSGLKVPKQNIQELRKLIIRQTEEIYEDKLSFLDDNLKKEITEKNNGSLKNLNTLEEKIISGWNSYYINLNQLTHQINLLAQFKGPIEKISTAYLLAKEIMQNADLSFGEKNCEFSRLCDWVEKTNSKLKEYEILEMKNYVNVEQPNLLTMSQSIDSKKLEEIGKMPDFFDSYIEKDSNLINEYDSLLKLQSSNLYGNSILLQFAKIKETAYLISSTEINKTNALSLFDSQKIELSTELANYKIAITEAYEVLKNVCKDAELNINQEIEKNSPKPQEKSSGSWFNSKPVEKQLPGKVKSPFEK